jgi:hypothetical protein
MPKNKLTDNSTDVNFCENVNPNLISEIIPLFLSLEKDELIKLYDFFKRSFENFEHYRDIPLSEIEELVNLPINLVNEKYQFADNLHHVGVDIPVWLSKNGNNKKAFICAMDPLRSCNFNNQVSIWTPFSISTYMAYPHQKMVKNYWPFLQTLLNTADIYLTDIFKVYYQRDLKGGKTIASNKDKEFKKGNLLELHGDIIKKEIDLYKPDVIITLGGDAYKEIYKLRNYTGATPIIALPHLSYAAGGAKKKFILSNKYEYQSNCTAETIAKIVISKHL